MMGLMGNGDGHTLLILTDDESRLLREYLKGVPNQAFVRAYNAGIARGTAKLAEESKAEQARKKAAKK